MLTRLEKYGALNSHDLVKFVALLIMTIDHIGAYLLPDELWWRAVGRITFPVWFFLIGYARSTKISTELLWGVVILMASNLWAYYPMFPLNALVSIILCRLVLRLSDRYALAEKHPLTCWVAFLFFNIPLILLWEYGMIAVMYAFCGRMVQQGLRSHAHKAFWVLSTFAFLFWQAHVFDFTEAQMLFVTFGTASVCVWLYHYEQEPLPLHLPRAADFAVKLLSRYSLQYYVAHRVVFQMVGAYVLHNHPHITRLFY